jgi:MFS family permease
MAVDDPTSTGHSDSSSGFRAYGDLIRIPGTRPILLAFLLARLPTGMGSIGLILFVHEIYGSFGSAGLVGGAFVAGLGVTGPVLARQVDQRGPSAVVSLGGAAAGGAFVVVYFLGQVGAPIGALAAPGFLAGAALPPVGSVLRRYWATVLPSDRQVTAYAIESILLDFAFIVGPALAGALAAAFGAGVALLVASGASVLGTVWFSSLVNTRYAKPDKREQSHFAGALQSRFLRVLILSGLPLGAGIGVLDVALPAFGAAHGSAALGGPYAAALAAGSVCGGAAYALRPDTFGTPGRAVWRLAALQGLACVPMLFAGTVTEMYALAGIAGSFWAPLMTVRSRLIQSGVEFTYIAEAFSWDGLGYTIGAGLGSVIAGSISSAHGWRAAAGLGCVLPLVSGLVAFLWRSQP